MVLTHQAGTSGHPRLYTYSMNLARAPWDGVFLCFPTGVGSEEAMPGRALSPVGP